MSFAHSRNTFVARSFTSAEIRTQPIGMPSLCELKERRLDHRRKRVRRDTQYVVVALSAAAAARGLQL